MKKILGGILTISFSFINISNAQNWNIPSNGTAVGGATYIGTSGAGVNPLRIGTNGIERIKVTSTGTVCIGTTIPIQKFQIDLGNVLTRGTNNFSGINDEAFNYLGDVNNYIKAKNGLGLSLGTNTLDRLTVYNGGNVGIGTTTNPNYKLQIDGGNVLTRGSNNFINTGDAAYNYLGDLNNYIKAENSAGLRLGAFNAFDALTVANGGYVGIGIGNGGGSTFTYPSFMPTSMLHVSRWNPGDAFALFNLPKSGFGNTYGFLVGLEGSHSNDAVLAAQSGNMKFFTNITGNSSPYPPDEANGNLRMTIEGTTGDVGIGTSNPMQRLDINGRVQVQRGVIQKGGNAITSTSDLGLYSLDQSSWLRFVTNAQPMKFYADAVTDPIGVNPLVTINPTGFVNIDKGGIQKGGPTITSTTDLGLYSLDPNAWMRFVTNAQPMKFYTDANVDPKGSNEIMEISPYGQVYIGQPSWPTNNNTNELKLLVKGGILCQKVKVALDGTANWSWPDFVFSTDYKLKSLEEVEQFIKENNHLPDVPSACEITENGIDLAEMNAKLLQKVEELTLHVIAQGKEIEELKNVMGTNK